MRRSFWEWLFYFLFLCALAVLLLFFVSSPSSATCETSAEVEPVAEYEPIEVIIINGDTEKEAEPAETYEDWFRENANKIENCNITHYCAELRKHICGTGDGITATGTPVIPYWTCAVDPKVIPYGSEVMVDYGDRVEFWKAQDCGGSINGNEIDLAVWTHEEALGLGVVSANVYWMEVE